MTKSKIGISEPEESTHFLGCKHHVEKIEKDGHTINYIKYDMEKFLSSCCDTYEQLATECGQKVSWDTVATPFIEENDWEDLSRRPLADDEDGLKCPYCQGIYPEDCFEKVPRGLANQRQYASCQKVGSGTSVGHGASQQKGSGTPVGHAANSKKNTKLEERLDQPPPDQPQGRLNSIAARVLMKVFYAARLARFDLLRAVANLARYLTKWTKEMDLILMKLMQYLKIHIEF